MLASPELAARMTPSSMTPFGTSTRTVHVTPSPVFTSAVDTIGVLPLFGVAERSDSAVDASRAALASNHVAGADHEWTIASSVVKLAAASLPLRSAAMSCLPVGVPDSGAVAEDAPFKKSAIGFGAPTPTTYQPDAAIALCHASTGLAFEAALGGVSVTKGPEAITHGESTTNLSEKSDTSGVRSAGAMPSCWSQPSSKSVARRRMASKRRASGP